MWTIGTGLEGKGVIVTGAGGGIGREVAQAFASVGARVAAIDLMQDSVDEVVAALPGGPHLALGFDVREIARHADVVGAVKARFGRVDVLANLAAVLVRRADIDDVTEADWDFQHDVNLKAAFFLNRAVAQALRAQGQGGRLINFSSQGWWTGGFAGSVVYSATKGAIVSMTRGLARTYAKDRITVNAVAPGATDTPMLRSGLTEADLAAQIAPIPLGYMAEPKDMAGTVIFLASDHASYITGATINVSGGWLMY
jgi:NAD(P)-dependent dehydrogenase (short-subunit alcohol dehydrogenase family)